MPDQEPSADARLRDAIKTVAKGLEARGVLKESALAIAKRHEERLFVSSSGAIRVASAGGTFYPANAENPFEHLVGELYHAVPATDKAAGSAEDLDANRQRLRRTGQY